LAFWIGCHWGMGTELEEDRYGNGHQNRVPQYGLEGVDSPHEESQLPTLGREEESGLGETVMRPQW